MSVGLKTRFTGMYAWTQTNPPTDVTPVAIKDVTFNLVRFLHWRLMYQFLSSWLQLGDVYIYTHALTHRHTLSLEHRLLCAPGAVALEGYSKGSILKGCCHGDNYGAHLPWASKLYTTFLPAEHGLSHTQCTPHLCTNTRTIFSSFLPFMVNPAESQYLTWTERDSKQKNGAISS